METRLREKLFPNWLWRLPDKQALAVTFDDGPDAKTTPELLKTLERLRIPATMFVLGERVASHADLLRECAAAGHAIANHGYTHESWLWRSSRWQSAALRRTEDALEMHGIAHQRLLRPPYGHFNPATAGVLRRCGYSGVLWSQIVDDWKTQDVPALEQRLCHGAHGGGILLLHDDHATTISVLKALPRLTEEAERRGWRFVTLNQPLLPQSTSL